MEAAGPEVGLVLERPSMASAEMHAEGFNSAQRMSQLGERSCMKGTN